MWIGLFAIVIAIAICLGVAAFVMQRAARHTETLGRWVGR